ncbi:MAG: PAS domain-containing sensor histidine kinase [Anaerolineae bacterium]|nr:PAS domain-containing sensor histidine kinase [Anaerolineae bacterium]
MRTTLGGLFVPPRFDDPEQTRVAALLHVILLACLLAIGLYMLIVPLTMTAEPFRTWLAVLAFFPTLGLFVFMRRMPLRLASLLLVVVLWVGITLAAITGGGIHSPSFVGYVIPILVAGFLMGQRSGMTVTILSAFSGLCLAYAENNQILPLTNITRSPFSIWIILSLFFFVTVVLLSLVMRSITDAMAQTRREMLARQQADMAAANSNTRLRALVSALPDLALVLDSDGIYREIIAVNPRLLYTGDKETMLGHHVTEILPSPQGEAILTTVRRTIETGQTYVLEYELDVPAGHVWYEGRTALMHPDTDGDPLVLWVARDITQLKQAESRRLDAERLLLEIENEKHLLSVREDFISMVSHEFRSPLAIIQSSKNMLERYYDRMNDESRHEHLSRIEEQVNYLVTMIDDLLYAATPNSSLMIQELVDLEAEARKIFDLVKISITTTHRLVFESGAPLVHSLMDTRLLRQILTNLLTNAVKYSSDGSLVRLTLRRESNTAVFEVIDSGIGMSPEDQALLFEPFKRSKKVKHIQGSGLGMVIVKNALDALGGTIACHSQLNVGTTFIVRLPLVNTASSAG